MFLGGRFFIKSAKKRALAVGDARPGDGFCDRHRYLRREDVFRGERARVARGTRSRVSFFFSFVFQSRVLTRRVSLSFLHHCEKTAIAKDL